MRARTLGVIAGLAALGPAASALAAGDPIMPLRDVRPGMRCTGYSVFRGQAVEPFDVEIQDVLGQETTGSADPRLLVRVSGETVDVTGIGPGFSGSPIYCPAADGTMENAGAISETIGEYGGKTVLATPIEQILGTPVDAPRAAPDGAKRRRDAALMARARPLAAPITVSGVNPALMSGLTKAARAHGVSLLAAPPTPAQSSPLLHFQPGSAVGVGLSSGDITVGGIGTVAYVDGADVWAFGHSFDGAGARSLLLQDAYVSTIINNPLQLGDGGGTYKLAGAIHDRGTLTDDGFDAVAGRVGPLPPLTRVGVHAEDLDRHVQSDTEVTVPDETDLGNPTGLSALGFVAPIAVSQGATGVLGGAPQRLAARGCLQVVLRERRRPLGFCNRYVADGTTPSDGPESNPAALAAGTDASLALSLLDAYKGEPVHVTQVSARVSETRAQRQAYLRSVKLPRRIRRGATVPGRLTVQVVHGPRRTIPFRWRVPTSLPTGRRTLQLRGPDPDSGGGFFDTITIDLGCGGGSSDSEGPRSLEALRRSFSAVGRYDGIRLKSGPRVYLDSTYRIGGQAKAKVVVSTGRRGRARG
ncbi:MAG: hypothetical protein ACR2NB_06710 [Solirubrobacteraceae bacterium]